MIYFVYSTELFEVWLTRRFIIKYHYN